MGRSRAIELEVRGTGARPPTGEHFYAWAKINVGTVCSAGGAQGLHDVAYSTCRGWRVGGL